MLIINCNLYLMTFLWHSPWSGQWPWSPGTPASWGRARRRSSRRTARREPRPRTSAPGAAGRWAPGAGWAGTPRTRPGAPRWGLSSSRGRSAWPAAAPGGWARSGGSGCRSWRSRSWLSAGSPPRTDPGTRRWSCGPGPPAAARCRRSSCPAARARRSAQSDGAPRRQRNTSPVSPWCPEEQGECGSSRGETLKSGLIWRMFEHMNQRKHCHTHFLLTCTKLSVVRTESNSTSGITFMMRFDLFQRPLPSKILLMVWLVGFNVFSLKTHFYLVLL